MSLCFFALAPAAAQADPLPECPPKNDSANCQLTSKDRLGLVFRKRVLAGQANNHVTVEIEVVAPSGEVTQVVRQDSLQNYNTVQLFDVDGSGRDSLLIETGAGWRSVKYTIWRAVGAAPQFTSSVPDSSADPDSDATAHVNNLFGARFWRTADGFLGEYLAGPDSGCGSGTPSSRPPACWSWHVTFSKFDSDGALMLVAQAEKHPYNPARPDCVLTGIRNLAVNGLTSGSARDRLCAVGETEARATTGAHAQSDVVYLV